MTEEMQEKERFISLPEFKLSKGKKESVRLSGKKGRGSEVYGGSNCQEERRLLKGSGRKAKFN